MKFISFYRLKHTFYAWLPALLLVMFVLNNTTPDRVGPQGVTFFFGLLYLFFSLSINLLWLVMARVSTQKHWYTAWQPSYSFIYGFIPTTALALESLDQLIIRDILIFVGLAVLIGFYIAKRPRGK